MSSKPQHNFGAVFALRAVLDGLAQTTVGVAPGDWHNGPATGPCARINAQSFHILSSQS